MAALDDLLAERAAAAPTGGGLDDLLAQRAAGTSLVPAAPKGNASAGGIGGGLLTGLRDTLNGGAQLLYNALPASVQKAGDSVDNWLFDKTGGAIGVAPGGLNHAIAAQDKQYEADRAAAGRSGFDAARALGNVISGAPIALATGGTSTPATLGAALLRGGAAGAMNGAAAPVTDDSGGYWGQKTNQVAAGAAAGGVGSALGRALANVASPVVGAAQKKLLDAGIDLTPGQILGGAYKRIEDAATSVPVLGDMIRNSQRRSFDSMNTAVVNQALAPIGQQLPKGVTGREAIAFADDAIGNAYNSTLAKIGAVHPDAQFGQDMAQLSGLVQNVPKDKGQQFVNILRNEVASRIDGNNVMTAEGFKQADANIGQLARGYLRSQDADTNTLGAALMQAQRNLRGMLERVAPPAESDALKAANASFAMFLRPQRASSALGAEQGTFTPAQLQNAVKALDSSKRKGSFSTGDALLQDLSDPAVAVMGNKVPDSGTPFRHAVQAGIAGALGHSMIPEGAMAAAPVAGAAFGAAMLPYTQTGGKVAQALLAGDRGPASSQLALMADMLRRYSVPVAGSLTPALVKARSASPDAGP